MPTAYVLYDNNGPTPFAVYPSLGKLLQEYPDATSESSSHFSERTPVYKPLEFSRKNFSVEDPPANQKKSTTHGELRDSSDRT